MLHSIMIEIHFMVERLPLKIWLISAYFSVAILHKKYSIKARSLYVSRVIEIIRTILNHGIGVII